MFTKEQFNLSYGDILQKYSFLPFISLHQEIEELRHSHNKTMHQWCKIISLCILLPFWGFLPFSSSDHGLIYTLEMVLGYIPGTLILLYLSLLIGNRISYQYAAYKKLLEKETIEESTYRTLLMLLYDPLIQRELLDNYNYLASFLDKDKIDQKPFPLSDNANACYFFSLLETLKESLKRKNDFMTIRSFFGVHNKITNLFHEIKDEPDTSSSIVKGNI